MPSDVEETLRFLQSMEQTHTTSPNDQIVPPGERECPICKKTMSVEVVEGVSLDNCQDHGVWLDFGELQQIISRIRQGERVSRRYAIRRAKEERQKDNANNAMVGLLALSLICSD